MCIRDRVVPVRHGLLRIDVLPQRGVQIRALQIVRRKGVAREDGVDIAVFDQLGHRRARVMVKGKGRAHDPDDLAVVALVAQQVVKLVVISGKGRLAGTVLPEGEGLLLRSLLAEAVGVDIDCLLYTSRCV